MNVNGSTQPADSNNQLSNGPAPWGHSSVAPTPYRFVQTNTQSDLTSSSQLSFSGLNQILNAPAIPTPVKPEANRPQATGNSISDSYEMDAEAYEQWLRNNPEGAPDLNNPYLKELIKQYSDKIRAARQQKLSGTSNEQASQTQNSDTWLQ
jgi:hypothetical protein